MSPADAIESVMPNPSAARAPWCRRSPQVLTSAASSMRRRAALRRTNDPPRRTTGTNRLKERVGATARLLIAYSCRSSGHAYSGGWRTIAGAVLDENLGLAIRPRHECVTVCPFVLLGPGHAAGFLAHGGIGRRRSVGGQGALQPVEDQPLSSRREASWSSTPIRERSELISRV